MKNQNVQVQALSLPSSTIKTKRYECHYLTKASKEWCGITHHPLSLTTYINVNSYFTTGLLRTHPVSNMSLSNKL